MITFIDVGRQERMGTISKDFSFREFEASDTAARLRIDNTIKDWDVRDNIVALVENVLQPLRDAWGGPIFIGPRHSGYRCPELNSMVGGVKNSQHQTGEAADCGVTDPFALAKLLLSMNIEFDQLGLYPSFCHISYKRDGENRREVFYAKTYKGPKLK